MTDFFDHWMNESEENKKLVEKERLKLYVEEMKMKNIVEILKESKMHIQAICEDKKFVLDRHEGVFKHQTDKVILLQLEKYEQLLKDINDWLEFMEQSED